MGEAQAEDESGGGNGFVGGLFAEDEAGEGADGEGDDGSDEDVPGEGDVGDGDGAEVNGEVALPEVEVEGEAGDHADDGSGLGCVLGEGSEEEDAEEAAVGYGGDGEAGFDDMAFASGVDAVDGDGEEDEGPEDGGCPADEDAFAI